MENNVQFRPVKSVQWTTRLASYATILLVGVLIGFVPMWIRERAGAKDVSAAATRAGITKSVDALAASVVEKDLNKAVLQNALASAAIDVQRGDYESARQYASGFFTGLREEVDKGDGSSLTPAQRDGVQSLFAMQDEVITLLARNDPAAAGRFSDLYVSFRELMTE
ncbi:MAG: hypothetical protein ACYCYF_01055 [Anaerolineae bacterium]